MSVGGVKMDLETRKKILTGLYMTIISSGLHTKMDLINPLVIHTEMYLREKHYSDAPTIMKTFREVQSLVSNVALVCSQSDEERYRQVCEMISRYFVISPEWADTIAEESVRGANEFSILNRARASTMRATIAYAASVTGDSSEYGNALTAINETLDCITRIFSYEDILDGNFDKEFRKNMATRTLQERPQPQAISETGVVNR